MVTRIGNLAPERHGTTIVETAVILPAFFLFVFAIIEFGHAQLVNNMLSSACRKGARVGAVEGTTTAQVIAQVNETMSPVAPAASIAVFVKDASIYDTGIPPTTGVGIEAMPNVELSDAEPRQMFVIRASVPLNDVALVPMPFLKNVVLDGQSFMRHE
ncbi:MAG: pilus assembly protein [Pirellulales bacterium]|nr:pilus assembly protein [Pirellulales bacterium]